MQFFWDKSKKFLDIGCADAFYFFRSCLKHPENMYYLVDIDDWYFTRMDDPQRIYNNFKSTSVSRAFVKLKRPSVRSFQPHKFYPKEKPFNEVIEELIGAELPTLSRLSVRDLYQSEDKFLNGLMERTGYFDRPLLDFLYSNPERSFIRFIKPFCDRMKFFHLDATKRMLFKDRFFDRVYSCDTPAVFDSEKYDRAMYAEAVRLSKEGVVRTSYADLNPRN